MHESGCSFSPRALIFIYQMCLSRDPFPPIFIIIDAAYVRCESVYIKVAVKLSSARCLQELYGKLSMAEKDFSYSNFTRSIANPRCNVPTCGIQEFHRLKIIADVRMLHTSIYL